MKSLKEYIYNEDRSPKTVNFMFYRSGNLWYEVDDFKFPVPVTDIGDATFLASDKASLFMRYIRKHLNEIKQ